MRAVKRLNEIAKLVSMPNDVVADIGADHGHLAEILIKENRAKKVIATDISPKSIEKTRNLSKALKIEDKIECRVGDGLDPIKSGEVGLAVIAGMGGYEIIKILKRRERDIKEFVLQPAQNAVQLREYLAENFKIEQDFIVKDKNKFYNTFKVVRSNQKQKLSDRELEYGLTNFDLRSDDFRDYLLDDIKKKQEILKDKKSPALLQRVERSKEILKELYQEGE